MRAGEETAMAWTHRPKSLSQTFLLEGSHSLLSWCCCAVFHPASSSTSLTDLWMQDSVPTNPVVWVGVSFFVELTLSCGFEYLLQQWATIHAWKKTHLPPPLPRLETPWVPQSTKAFTHLSNGDWLYYWHQPVWLIQRWSQLSLPYLKWSFSLNLPWMQHPYLITSGASSCQGWDALPRLVGWMVSCNVN